MMDVLDVKMNPGKRDFIIRIMSLMTVMVMMTVIMWRGCSQPPAVILVISPHPPLFLQNIHRFSPSANLIRSPLSARSVRCCRIGQRAWITGRKKADGRSMCSLSAFLYRRSKGGFVEGLD